MSKRSVRSIEVEVEVESILYPHKRGFDLILFQVLRLEVSRCVVPSQLEVGGGDGSAKLFW
jgi:hypothetical protein